MFYKLLPNYYPDKEDGMITIPVKQLNLDQVLEVLNGISIQIYQIQKICFLGFMDFINIILLNVHFYINNNNYNKIG